MEPSTLRAATVPPLPDARSGTWWLIAVLLCLVFALQLALAAALAGHPLLQPADDLDTGEYWRLAGRVAAGDVLLHGLSLHVSPLYIYWLALALTLTGGSLWGVLAVQAAAGTAAVWLVGRTAAAWVQPAPVRATVTAAVVAGASVGLAGIIGLQQALILQSAIDPILMAAFAFAATRAVQVGAPGHWAGCGVALASLAMNRPNAWMLALPCFAAVLLSARPGSPGAPRLRPRGTAAGALVLGIALVLAPFAVRTWVATGTWDVLPSHGGLNAYIGNHAGANGTYTVVDGIRPSVAGQREDMRRVAERAAGRSLSDAQVSSHFFRAAAEWWRESPGDALQLLAYKVWLSTHAWELPVNVSYAWFREQVWLLQLMPVGAWVLIPLGLAVSVAGASSVPDAHRPAWRWFVLLLPTYLLSVAVFFVVDRYRAPALILCAIHVGVLAGWLAQRAPPGASVPRPMPWRVLTAAGLVLLLCVSNLVPLPFQLGQADADTRMAVHAIDAGDDEQARRWLARAVTRHAAPGVAWLRAGLAWQARGDLPQAEGALREAQRLDPGEPAVAFALGEVLIAQGRGADAVPLLTQAFRAGLRPDRVRLDLALALWQAGDQTAARATLASRLPAEALPLLRARALASADARRADLAAWLLTEYRRYVPADAEVVEKLGLVAAQQGDTGTAAALLEHATRLDAGRATAWFNLAIAHAREGRRAEAVALLRKALRIDPTYAQAAGALRELLGNPGEPP